MGHKYDVDVKKDLHCFHPSKILLCSSGSNMSATVISSIKSAAKFCNVTVRVGRPKCHVNVQAEEFYEIIAERHQRGSIVITSNRPPGDWLSLFPDQVMANSAIDRLSHRAHHIAMKGESYSNKIALLPNKPINT